jgi:hypothetical protein
MGQYVPSSNEASKAAEDKAFDPNGVDPRDALPLIEEALVDSAFFEGSRATARSLSMDVWRTLSCGYGALDRLR